MTEVKVSVSKPVPAWQKWARVLVIALLLFVLVVVGFYMGVSTTVDQYSPLFKAVLLCTAAGQETLITPDVQAGEVQGFTVSCAGGVNE